MKTLTALLVVILAATVARGAEVRPPKAATIGFLLGGSPSSPSLQIDIFKETLRENGWVEGRNLALEFRFAEGTYDKLAAMAADLVGRRVDVIVTEGTPPTRAAQQATKTIPIVMATTGDPVGTGLVGSVVRPGGNVTGASFFFAEINAKRRELLRDAVPKAIRVGVLYNPGNPAHGPAVSAMAVAARSLKLNLQRLEARTPAEVDATVTALTRRTMDALAVVEDLLINVHSGRIAEVALRNRLPAVFGLASVVHTGGLMSYAPNRSDLWRRAALLTDKILRGARPGDLPIEQAQKFDLTLNLKTAAALGLNIPQSRRLRADQALE